MELDDDLGPQARTVRAWRYREWFPPCWTTDQPGYGFIWARSPTKALEALREAFPGYTIELSATPPEVQR